MNEIIDLFKAKIKFLVEQIDETSNSEFDMRESEAIKNLTQSLEILCELEKEEIWESEDY